MSKLAVSALKNNNRYTYQLPRVYYIYYAYVAPLTEPLQSCADNLRRGFEFALSCGDRSNAFGNSIHDIRLSLLAGTNLPTLLKRTEYYLEVMKRCGQLNGLFLELFRDTILILMGQKKHNLDENEGPLNDIPPESQIFHKAIRSYWSGHLERCYYLTEKVRPHHRRNFMFHHGINALRILAERRNSRRSVRGTKSMRAVPAAALKSLKESCGFSKWNFHNKLHLLEAEIFSSEGNNDRAKDSYEAAIISAKSAGFIQEQGLACERAGVHYSNIGDLRRAHNYLLLAKQCYSEWGSQMKVLDITEQIDEITHK